VTLSERIPEPVKVLTVIVSIAGLVSAVAVACWTRSDVRRESAGVAYAAVIERVGRYETKLDAHLDWAGKEDLRLLAADETILEAVGGLQRDLVATRILLAEQAATAKENNVLLHELLRQIQRNARANSQGQ
jgi:hypothetical protein